MYSKRAVTLALTLLLLSSYSIIAFNPAPTGYREALLSHSIVLGENDPYIRTRFAGGDGTEENPYQISNVSQLQDMNLDLYANYTLINDIDASETTGWNSGKGFAPIGDDYSNKFYGKLDGQGYYIAGLFINRPSDIYVGLIGCIGSGGCINNISIVNGDVIGYSEVGGLAGMNQVGGTVLNCSVGSNVSGYWDTNYFGSVGGLIGDNRGTVENCSATGTVFGDWTIGGLIGWNHLGAVKNCFATGEVTGRVEVGGFMGGNRGNVNNCYATGKVSAEGYVGGLIGENEGMIENCHASGDTSANIRAGGLCGRNEGTIKKTYATGNVIGYRIVGGLVGENNGTLISSHATGDVSGDYRAGGLVGFNDGSVEKCYAINNVTGRSLIGGFVGYNIDGIVLNSFYCIDYSMVNEQNLVTPYGIYKVQFDDWLDNDKKLSINDHMKKIQNTDYYAITNISDLKDMLSFAISEDYKFQQTANIDLSSEPGFYIPIFNSLEYNGNRNSISNMSISILNNRIGVFGYFGRKGRVLQFNSSECKVSGYGYVGGLIGHNFGTIINCSVTGYVSGTDSYIGGLIGRNLGTVSHCQTSTNVSGINYVHYNLGGLVGENKNIVENCFAIGNVSGYRSVGGLIGQNTNGNMKNCYAIGNVYGYHSVGGLIGGNSYGNVKNCHTTGNVTGDEYVGGLVGIQFHGEVENCFAIGGVTGNDRVGGLVGDLSQGKLLYSYATGSVTGGFSIGGLVGKNEYGNVENCYAIGSATGIEMVGGLVGEHFGGEAQYCYAIGPVSGSTSVGGLIGDTPFGGVENCFWNVKTTGQTDSDGGTGKTTAMMMNKNTYTDAGWDLTEVWVIGNEKTYPHLRSIYSEPVILTKDEETAIQDLPYEVKYKAEISTLPGTINTAIFSLTTNASWLSITHNGTLFGIPENKDVGSFWVNVSATDLVDCVDFHNFSIVVSNINDPLVITTNNVITATEDELYSVRYNALDIDPSKDVFIWSLSTDAKWLTIDSSDGWLNGTPINSDVGVHEVNISVTSNADESCFINFSLVVTNSPPLITTISYTNATEDELYFSDFNCDDDDQGAITWHLSTNGTWLFFDGTSGELYGTPSDDDVGQNLISVSVDDGNGGMDWYNYTLEIVNVNDPPIINTTPPKNATPYEHYFIYFEAIDEDPTNDVLNWSLMTNATWLMIKSRSGYLSGIAMSGFFWVNVSVSDGNGGMDFINYTLMVRDMQNKKDTDMDGVPDLDDAFPDDPAASIDSDGDGMPDEWNPGMNQSDSTSYIPLELDPYPNDPDNKPPDDDSTEIPSDSSSRTWIWISLIVVVVILIAVFIAVMVKSKRKPLEKEEKDDLGRIELSEDN